MYTIGDLKKFIEMNNLPDDMPVSLLDSTTDDSDDMNYGLSDNSFEIADYFNFNDDSGEPEGKMLFITFENKLNENPI